MSYLKANFFSIDCLTNMLAGSGKANYGVIDQLVQRDTSTKIPVIHASSLKGAVKEFCTHNNSLLEAGTIRKVFGSVKDNNNDTGTGQYKFLDAHLLLIPVRSDKRAYVHITCPLVLENFAEHLTVFGKYNDAEKIKSFCKKVTNRDSRDEAWCFVPSLNEAVLEEFEFKARIHNDISLYPDIKNILKDDFIITSDYIFKALTNDLHLPVIARNHLENGESENLWYEQVIPSRSRFWFTLLSPVDENCGDFEDLLTANNSVIQIGANATVGYGYTKCNPINLQ